MLFNSFQFLLFFPAVVLLYFLLPTRARWFFLLVASYYFYMNWNPIYAILMFTSTFVTWLFSLLIYNKPKDKKIYLFISLFINFSLLFFYKYFNFINTSLFEILEYFGLKWTVPNLDILLPVGISFYTFQAVGYTIDVYREELRPEHHLGKYALFVSFFPQLVAGPIERAKELLPQFHEVKSFSLENFKSGLTLMIWGYFMKVVVSDRIGMYVDITYNNVEMHNGNTFLLSTILFSFQIYCDFAGYSNIAIGAARIMGFSLMTNFKRPYFSTNISEFWHRWHISLSTWFRDYLYIPLGGNRVTKRRANINIFITFLVSGLWHGANWTFVIWGALHGVYNIVQRIFNFDKISKKSTSIRKGVFILTNFILVLIAWIFFRANSVGDAIQIIYKIFRERGSIHIDGTTFIYGSIGLFILFTKEIREEFFPNRNRFLENDNVIVSSFALSLLVILIISLGIFSGGQFIYFQF